MICDTKYKASGKFLPPRNTQSSRHNLLKKQREQILKLRQVNLVAHDVSILKSVSYPLYCSSRKCCCTRKETLSESSEQNVSNLRLPKTQRSPYASCLAYNPTSIKNQKKPWTPSNNGRHLIRSANQNQLFSRKITAMQQFQHSKVEVNGLKQCYRRICNDDIESFKLLLKNQDRFGKPKIPFVVEQKPQETIHFRTCSNPFPSKKAPYVPQSFLRRTRKKPVSPTMEPLSSSNNKTSSYNNSSNHNNKDSKGKQRKINEPCIIVDSPSTATTANLSSTMSREEFISINESMLDEDMMTVPATEGLLLSRSSSSVSNIIEEMIMNRKINVADKNNKKQNDDTRTDDADEIPGKEKPLVIKEDRKINIDYNNSKHLNEGAPFNDILKEEKPKLVEDTSKEEVPNEMTSPPSIGLQVMDEYGEEKHIIWHNPDEQTYRESSEEVLSLSKGLAAKRKLELKQLLEEYSTIASQLDQTKVN